MKMRHSPRRSTRLWAVVAAIVLTLEVPSMCEAGEPATRAAPAAVAPLKIGSRRELFTDRFLIEDMKGTELRLHSPQRKETAIVFDQPWEGAHTGYVTVLADKDHPKDSPQFLMYYRGWPSWFDKDGKAIRGREVTCVAHSEDGIRWIKPSLTLYEFTDQKSGSRFRTNNIVLPPDDPAASHNFTPFIDTRPGVPASERFKALTGSFKDGRPFWGYVSGDGIHWRKISKEPLLNKKNWPLRSDGASIPCFWSDSDKCYFAYFRIWIDHNKQPMAAPGAGNDEKGWRWFGRARSEDFIHWKDVEPINVDGPVVEHLYTSEVQPYFRAPHLLLSFPCRMVYRKALSDAELDKFKVGPDNRQNVNDGAFMTSRDGLHFERTFMESFLRPGLDRRSWSGRNNYAACGVLSTGPEELSLYYDQGNDQLTEPSRKHLVRCTLRTDGFVSVHAPYRGGELLTKPLIFEGNSLEINYATSASGEVRIEVQSGEGRPIEGFTLSKCDAIFGDQISRTVTWGGNADVSKISGKPIKLRFVLKDADLYSFRWDMVSKYPYAGIVKFEAPQQPKGGEKATPKPGDGVKAVPDGLKGWKETQDLPADTVVDDYNEYIEKLPKAERPGVSDVIYYVDNTGRNAVAVLVNVGDIQWTHLLVYDKQNKRASVAKFVSGK